MNLNKKFHIMEKIKRFLCFVIGRTINGYLNQQSFVLHHNMSNRKQDKYPTSFDILQNLDTFCLHKLYKFCKVEVSFKVLGKIIVQGLKQTINYTHHLQM